MVTSNYHDVGNYQIVVRGSVPAGKPAFSDELIISLDVLNDELVSNLDVVHFCRFATLTIDTAIFKSPALTYIVKDLAATLSWTDSAVTNESIFANCGTFTWMVTKKDGITEIDSTVFTLDSANRTISVHTTDLKKASSYTMRVKVYLTDFPEIHKSQDFSILIMSPKQTEILSTNTILDLVVKPNET